MIFKGSSIIGGSQQRSRHPLNICTLKMQYHLGVALIKTAKETGINCTVDVVEIPKQFFSEEKLINPEKCKVLYYDKMLKNGHFK